MRGLYKDMVWLLNHASLIPNEVLGAKSEENFPDMEKTKWKEVSHDFDNVYLLSTYMQ